MDTERRKLGKCHNASAMCLGQIADLRTQLWYLLGVSYFSGLLPVRRIRNFPEAFLVFGLWWQQQPRKAFLCFTFLKHVTHRTLSVVCLPYLNTGSRRSWVGLVMFVSLFPLVRIMPGTCKCQWTLAEWSTPFSYKGPWLD